MGHMDLRCSSSQFNCEPLLVALASRGLLDEMVDHRAGDRNDGRGRGKNKETSCPCSLIERPVIDLQTRIRAGFHICPRHRAIQRYKSIAERNAFAASRASANHGPA